MDGRKWRENEESESLSISSFSLYFLSISLFSLHFLFIFSFSLHFLAARLPGCHNLCNPAWSLDTLKWADPNRVKRELLHLLTILTCQGQISELLVLSQVYKCWTGIFFEEVPCKHTFSSDIFCDQERVRNMNLSSRYKLSIFTFIVTNMKYQLR